MTFDEIVDEIINLTGGNGLSTNQQRVLIKTTLEKSMVLRESEVHSNTGERSIEERRADPLD